MPAACLPPPPPLPAASRRRLPALSPAAAHLEKLASTAVAVAAAAADILLSWDYWETRRKLAEGEGVIAELPTIPKQFGSVEVRGGQGVARECVVCFVCSSMHSE